jgi:hypothetical protein
VDLKNFDSHDRSYPAQRRRNLAIQENKMAKTDAVLNGARRDKAPLPGPHIYAEDVAEFVAGMIVPANDPDPQNIGIETKFPNTKDDALVAVVNTNNPSEIHMYRGEQKEERLAFILHVAEKSSDEMQNRKSKKKKGRLPLPAAKVALQSVAEHWRLAATGTPVGEVRS